MTLPDPDTIDQLLPQTQCRQCGFDGCAPYARAISQGLAPVNRCPPGGQAGIERLARLTGLPALPLDPQCGVERPRRLAWIDPQLCIGCTKCILACPVDAIIGAPKWLHAVAPGLCTGCELCLAPCPVDCIRLVPADEEWSIAMADAARSRYRQRSLRLQRDAQRDARRLAAKALAPAPLPACDAVEAVAVPAAEAPTGSIDQADTHVVAVAVAGTGTGINASADADADAARKRAMVEAAIARARQRLAPGSAGPLAPADARSTPQEPTR